ncbi:pyridoxal phosphate-dependent transferase [Phlebopus sp. FC_14]|nr:pyridoxal phosphate-dependent transferase [Phlebopus sp. FC_14]
MDIEQFRRAGYKAIDHICDYYYSLQNKPVASQVEPGYLKKVLPPAAPITGEDFDLITDDYQKYIVPGLTHWQHPAFFAYFPTASTFEAILGDLYANGIGPNPGFNWSASPACTELEAIVMDWAANLFGLDKTFYNASEIGGGVIQTTASDSALVAVVAARSRYLRQNPGVSSDKLVLYTTTQTHSLGKKAGLILGVNVRALEVTSQDDFALRGERLRQAIAEDASAGLHPFILIATIGTTSSGAIDRLGELGEITAQHQSLWLHVDAAWAGVSLACPEYRELCLLEDVNKYADSFCTNFHKWGLVNFDCSAFWARDRKNLTDALDVTPEFLRSKHGDAGTVIDYRNWHLGLGRRFRSLKLWFVLRSFGVEGFQRYIRQAIKQNDVFVSLVRRSSDLKLVTTPCLALSVFRLEPPVAEMLSLAQMNSLNRSFYARLSARSDIALTQTDLNGVICIRMAIGAERTSEEHIKRAFEVLCEEAKVTIEAWSNQVNGETA